MDPNTALKKIRELETIIDKQGNQIINLRGQLEEQGVEVRNVSSAAMNVRMEDIEQLAAYKETNTELICFVEEIAASKSKFGKEARRLLGI